MLAPVVDTAYAIKNEKTKPTQQSAPSVHMRRKLKRPGNSNSQTPLSPPFFIGRSKDNDLSGGEVSAMSEDTKMYWAQWDSLSGTTKLCGNWFCPNCSGARYCDNPTGEHLGENKTLDKVRHYFTKWPEAYALPNQEARTVTTVLVNEYIFLLGVPAEIHSDQGRNFESTVFTEMCQLLDVHKTRTTALHPQSDGMVERYNRTLVGEHQGTWAHKLPLLLMSYRSAVHDTVTNYGSWG